MIPIISTIILHDQQIHVVTIIFFLPKSYKRHYNPIKAIPRVGVKVGVKITPAI